MSNCTIFCSFCAIFIQLISADKLGASWMKYLPDTMHLHEINLPGTHETGAILGTGILDDYAKCQSKTVTQQLEIGIRALDLRVYPVDSSNEFLKIYHYKKSMESTYGKPSSAAPKRSSQDDIEDQIESFLKHNQDECVIIKMKNEKCEAKDDCAPQIETALKHIVTRRKDLYFKLNTAATSVSQLKPISLQECRGKIVLILQYLSTSESYVSRENHYLLPAEVVWYNREKREEYWDGNDEAWVKVRYDLPWTQTAVQLRKDSWTERMHQTNQGKLQQPFRPVIGEKNHAKFKYWYNNHDTTPYFIQNSINANSAGKLGGLVFRNPEGYGNKGTPFNWNMIMKPFVSEFIIKNCYSQAYDGRTVSFTPKPCKTGIVGMDFAGHGFLAHLIFLTNAEWWTGVDGVEPWSEADLLKKTAQQLLAKFVR